MKMMICRKVFVFWLALCALIFCDGSIRAQNIVVSKSKQSAKFKSFTKKTKSKRKKIAAKIISLGVINGRAFDLVKPEFPKSAKAVNVYGAVSVSVLIDENGNVIEAKVINGHPFLQLTSIKAARKSKFEPLIFGGNAFSVRGIIIYNFVPDKWNWLEIGYALKYGSDYYSIKLLLETLPYELEEERYFLNQWFEANENRDQIIETIIASVRSKLSGDVKSYWLFEVGLSLAEYKRKWNIGGHLLDKNSESFQNLKQLFQNNPSEINTTLLEQVKEFIFFVEEGNTAQSVSVLRRLEINFPSVGR